MPSFARTSLQCALIVAGMCMAQCIDKQPPTTTADASRKLSSFPYSPNRLNEIHPQYTKLPILNTSYMEAENAVVAEQLQQLQHQPGYSVTARPVYTPEQYIDYYWHTPPVHHHRAPGGQRPETKQDADAAAAVERPPVNMSTIVKRTVSVVIEQIRSMWELVWSYFSEPAPSMLNAARSLLARTTDDNDEDEDEDDDDDDDGDGDEDDEDEKNNVDDAKIDNANTRETRHDPSYMHGLTRRRRRNRFRKFLVPLLMAYKLKFFTMIPMIIGGLVLLTGSAGMTGFFFALFTAVLSMKHKPV